jgi:hypothetical protein
MQLLADVQARLTIHIPEGAMKKVHCMMEGRTERSQADPSTGRPRTMCASNTRNHKIFYQK